MTETGTERLCEMTVVDPTPEERAADAERRRRSKLNTARYEELGPEIAEKHRGRYICIAEGQLYVGDDPRELHRATAEMHPEDRGAFYFKYVPIETGPVIHARRWRVVDVP